MSPLICGLIFLRPCAFNLNYKYLPHRQLFCPKVRVRPIEAIRSFVIADLCPKLFYMSLIIEKNSKICGLMMSSWCFTAQALLYLYCIGTVNQDTCELTGVFILDNFLGS